MIASLIKAWKGFDLKSLAFFEDLLSEQYQVLNNGLADAVLGAALAYVLTSYLMIENTHERGLDVLGHPSALAKKLDKATRLLLIGILSLKLFIPVNADHLLFIIFGISALIFFNGWTLNLTGPISVMINGRNAGYFVSLDFFCLFISLLTLVLIQVRSAWPYALLNYALLLLLTLFAIIVAGGSILRFWAHKSVLRALTVSLIDEPRIQQNKS